jgi:hypothetical protein
MGDIVGLTMHLLSLSRTKQVYRMVSLITNTLSFPIGGNIFRSAHLCIRVEISVVDPAQGSALIDRLDPDLK